MNINLKLGAITAAETAALAGAKLLTLSKDAPTREITNFTTEIGEITRGTMFIVSEDNSLAEMMAAAKNGAYSVLCTKAPASLERIPDTAVLVCDDIDDALGRLAKAYTARGGHKTIALTGAKGKTKTGEFVYSVLEEMYKVHKATDVKGGRQSDAQMLFDIPADTDFFLVELKLRDKRDIDRLADLIDCDVGIVTALKSGIDERSNLDVLSGLKTDGEIALSAEDDALSLICASDARRRQYVSVKNADGALCAENIRELADRTLFDIAGEGVRIFDVEIHSVGIDNVYSALFAALVGLKYGIPDEKIKSGLKNFHSSSLGVGIYTVGGVTFIEDSSSATPESVQSGIDTLCDIAKLHDGSRKIAVVGDLRNFGQEMREMHEAMGEYIVSKGIDKLFTFGVAAEQIGIGAVRAGMPKDDVCGNLELFSPLKTAEAVAKQLRAGDILLIRVGRQNAAAEIIRYLKAYLEKQ